MKKIKITHIISIIGVLLCVLCIIFGRNIQDWKKTHNIDYDKANETTKSFDEYGMSMSTIVTINDGINEKQNTIDQTVGVVGKNKGGEMIYSVTTTSTATDTPESDAITEESSYMYYNNAYYYTYPGVKYKSKVERESALTNIEKLTNIISFDYSDMVSPTTEYIEDYVIYSFGIKYESVSDYVKSILGSAINTFDSVKFSPVEVSASATVHKAGYVKMRELCIEYEGEGGQRIKLEIYTSLTDTPELEKPNESEYMNIAG